MIKISDEEAFEERKAILAELWPDMASAELGRRAGDSLYSTAWSKLLTAAANGDWKPAEALCERIRDEFGRAEAEKMREEIFDIVAAAIKEDEARKKFESQSMPRQGRPRGRKRR